MLIQFQYLLMTAILSSTTLYIFYSLKNLGDAEVNVGEFIQKLIGASIVSILISAFLFIKGILSDSFLGISTSNPIQSAISFAILVTLIMFSLKIIWSRRIFFNAEFRTPVVGLISAGFVIITPISAFESLYYISLTLFIATVSCFFYKVCFKLKMHRNAGIYYLLGGAITIVLSTIISRYYDESIYNTCTLSLMTLVMFGFFLFYVSYFVNELQSKVEQLYAQDKIITKKNQDIAEMALRDDITGIPNRLAFEQRLSEQRSPVYLGLLNIHGFMNFNNLLGFDRGNLILRDISKALDSAGSDKFSVFRHYADKFLILFNSDNLPDTLQLIQTITDLISNSNFQGVHLNAYFGINYFSNENAPFTRSTCSDVIGALEIASSMAKKNQNNVYLYAPLDHEQHNRITNLELNLRSAIIEKSFTIHYQPQLCSKSRAITSFEALIRWNNHGTFVSPAEFIPIAESKGLMSPITRLVVEQVFKDSKENPLFTGKRIAINLSVDQLVEEAFTEYVKEKVLQYRIEPQNIVFEITETSLVNDVERINLTLKALKKIGFQLSLDDFGNGYSSLFRFSKHEINEIKFDKAFIDDIANPKTYNTMKKTAELFKSFNMRIVAEGIETAEQLEQIKDFEIDLYQGFFFYRPESPERLRSVIGES